MPDQADGDQGVLSGPLNDYFNEMSPRRGHPLILSIAALALAGGVLIAATRAGGEDAARAAAPATAARSTFRAAAANVHAVPIHSRYETNLRVISRDGGVSVGLPDGHSLWLFGDTGIFQRAANGWRSTTFIDGSTSFLTKTAKGTVPTGAELPSGTPARFIPAPSGVYLPDGSGRPCTYDTAAFPARWPTGAAMFTKTEVIVTYSVVCVTTPGGHATARAEGWGYMLYNWKTRRIDQAPRDVFEPRPAGTLFASSKIFGSPRVSGGKVTFFSSQCDTIKAVGCASGRVWATTVAATTGALSNPASYKPTLLATDGSGKWQPLSISVGHYGNGLRLVEMATIVGNYKIFKAPTAGARWHLARSGTLPGCPTHTGFCLALEGHPDLSTPTQTFVSYKDADSGPGGHIVISALPN